MVDFDVRLGLTPTDWISERFRPGGPMNGSISIRTNSPELRLVQEQFPGAVVSSRLFRDEKTLTVKKEQIVGILKLLHDHAETNYNYLSDITCVDRLEFMKDDEPRFEVVYNIYSMGTFQRFRVKAQVTEDDASIDTVEGVYLNANWGERELWDMFGITINGHSDLRRILMPDDWIGHPLRKDYPIGGEEVEFRFNVREK